MLLLFLAFISIDRPCITDEYILQVGDKILVSVSGSINFAYEQTIIPQGNIFVQSPIPEEIGTLESGFPLSQGVLESVHIAGFTIKDALSLTEKVFNKYFKNVEVSLTVIEFTDLVYVTGAVSTPTGYPFLPQRTVREYIGLAGGPLPEGNIEEVKVKKLDGPEIKVALNTTVERGDVITIPRAYVYVRGAVEIPGAFPYNPDFGAAEYIGMAGGPTERGLVSKSYVIKKDGTKVSLKRAKIEKGNTIVVKKVFLKWWEDYLTIASAVTTVIIAWLTITK